MPSTSKKQHNFMEAIAHNPAFAKKVGVPQSVGQDFSTADKGRKFAKGGDTMATKGVNPFAKFEKSGKDVEVKGKGKEGSKKEETFDKSQMGMKKGGMTMKMASGGFTSDDPRDMDPRMAAVLAAKMARAPGVKAPAVGSPMVRPPTDPRIAAAIARAKAGAVGSAPMKKGGMAKFAEGGYTKAADGIAQRGKTQGAQPKMFAEGGFVRAADGIAQKGKTKAKQITMKHGGKC
jgi:hypothetical protein